MVVGYHLGTSILGNPHMGHTASSCLTDSHYILATPRNVKYVVETSTCDVFR